MDRAALIKAAIQHVKDVGPNSYEEWVGLIIDIACGTDPTRHPGERSPDTPSPVPLSCVWPDEEEDC